jgi:hypothetical protein
MEEITGILVLIGFMTGMCLGSVAVLLQQRSESVPPSNPQIDRMLTNQRDSIRSLRMDFIRFRDNHDRELITLLRETLRNSPRSVASVDEEPNASS